jgi:serine/threonine protein kinase
VKNRKFGKYEVLQRLGRGGMAEVYRAYHPNLDRFVAIKVLHSFLSDEGEFKARFEKEAQNIARLRHPNIVQVYDFDFDEDTDSYFMVMEIIEGPTLKDYLYDPAKGVHKLPLNEALRIIRQAAEALSYAHQRGMIHRDVKPANLMLDEHENNRVVLTDFGIAKLLTGSQNTMSGGLVGTPAYMSPEQGMGETGDERSDLYSLGVILYQMLTGELPYDAETPMALLLQHMNDPIPSIRAVDPHLSPAVDKVLQKLMAKEPAERYQTAQELINDLEILERTPARLDPTTLVLPRMPSAPPLDQNRKAEDKKPRVPVALILLIIGLIGIVGGVYAVGTNSGAFAGLGIAGLASDTPTPSPTPSTTSTPEPTATRTASPTPSDTRTPVLTATPTPSLTPTDTATTLPTATMTSTPGITPTVNETLTPTPNATHTAAAIRTATTSACRFDYAIISQTPEDGEEGGFFRTGEPYQREIRLLNTGSCAWDRNTSLSWRSGEDFDAGPRIFIEAIVEPGQETTLLFDGTLPRRGKVDSNGNVQPIVGVWQLFTPGQVPIGDPFEISIVVFDPGT